MLDLSFSRPLPEREVAQTALPVRINHPPHALINALKTFSGTAQDDVDGTESLLCESDVVRVRGLPGRQLHLVQLAQTLTPWICEDQAGFDADAVVSSASPEPVHQVHIAESVVGQQTDIHNPCKFGHALDVGQHRKQPGDADLCTGVLDDRGVQRH